MMAKQKQRVIATQYHTKANITIRTYILGSNYTIGESYPAADMTVIRLIKGVTMRDHIRNADI